MATHQHFRRCSDNRFFAHAEKKHVRRRVNGSQRSIDLERISLELCRKALRKHDLVTVARGNVVFNLAHPSFEVSARPVGFQRLRFRLLRPRRRSGPSRLSAEYCILQLTRSRHGFVVELSQPIMTAFRFFGQHYRDDLHKLPYPVESNDCPKKHPDRISWGLKRQRLVVFQCRLKPLGGIVTKIANGASRKLHHATALRKHTLAKVISDPFSRDDWKAFRLAFAFNESLCSSAPDYHFRLGAKEGIARTALAASY